MSTVFPKSQKKPLPTITKINHVILFGEIMTSERASYSKQTRVLYVAKHVYMFCSVANDVHLVSTGF